MTKCFNVTGLCRPEKHYMVDLSSRLEQMKEIVDNGFYFAITRGCQNGKTTMLNALEEYLRSDYEVVSLNLQMMCTLSFKDEQIFTEAFVAALIDSIETFPEGIRDQFQKLADGPAEVHPLRVLFSVIKAWCENSEPGVVLILDEIDNAMNHQVFLDFLTQLQAHNLQHPKVAAFQSVILAGIYDIQNIHEKSCPNKKHQTNNPENVCVSSDENECFLTFDGCAQDYMALSPYHISADFNMDMNFSTSDISSMLLEYEADHYTGMDIYKIAVLLYEYTSGHPYLVSRLCKLMDEYIAGTEAFPSRKETWTKDGFANAVKLLINEKNALFLSLKGMLEDDPNLRLFLYDLLFTEKAVPYTEMIGSIKIAAMCGFIRNENRMAVIHNRIFETVLCNWFMSKKYVESKIYGNDLQDKT